MSIASNWPLIGIFVPQISAALTPHHKFLCAPESI